MAYDTFLEEIEKRKTPYLIAEIGGNHNGDMRIVKKLIDATHACEWDCVKFQKRNVDKCIPEKQKNVIRETPWGTLTYIDYRRKLEFGYEQYKYINKYCSEKPIDWSASVWDEDSLRILCHSFYMPFIKIPSAILNDKELLKDLCIDFNSSSSFIVSTGMSTLKEIDDVVEIMREKNKKFMLMHCNSSYPTPPEEVNLNLIPFLKERYNCLVGFSDHSYGLESSIAAVALGAKVIERHITLDHDMWGTDQKASIEVHGMAMLKKRIEEVSKMLGDGIKRVTPSEISIKEKLRKWQ